MSKETNKHNGSIVVQRRVMGWGVSFQNKRYYHPKLQGYKGTIVFVQMKRKGLQITDRTGKFIGLAEAETFV
jgi:hypothetical protein